MQQEEEELLSKFSVKKPYTVLVGVILVIVLGVVSLTRMTTDLLPDMNLPYALVVTTDMGASPEEVETDVTAPIEASMATTSNIKNISSASYHNYSMVILEYEQSANMDSVLIEMQQKLDQLEGSWADSVGTPMIMQIDPDMMPVMVASADVDGMNQSEVSSYVENDLLPVLESIEGVASVTATGVLKESIQVAMNQEKIDALNEQILAKIEEQFGKAQDELDEASADIENGKQKLNSGKEQLAEQMGQAQNELVNGKSQLFVTESDMNTNLTVLTTAKKVLEQVIPEMQKLYDEGMNLKGQIEALSLFPELTPEQQETLQALKEQLAALQGKLEELKNQLEGILGNPGAADNAGNPANKDTVGTVVIENGKIGVEGIADKLLSLEEIPELIGKLTNTLSEINKGIITIYTAKGQIDEGKATLNDAYATLNETQISSILEMSEAAAKLADGESKLAQGQAQLDAAKESAKESADLNVVLTAEMLGNLLVAQNFSMPAGYVGEEDNRYMVSVGDKISDMEELENVVLLDLGMEGIEPIRLCDVADVEMQDNAKESYSKINGNPSVMLSIEKQTGYSTGDVTNRVKDKFAALEKEEAHLHTTILMNQGVYIDIIVDSVVENMIMGAALAVLILILFLKDFKPTLVIACSIPLSVIVAIVLMYFMDISLNIISLSGLALGIGMLVDNSIVVIENIYRLRHEGYSIRKAAVEGASQVTGAIIASTLTTVCVFAPIIFTEGITRQLFVDIGLTILFTLMASLIVALTFVPMMAAGVLKSTKEIRHDIFEKGKAIYGRVLAWSLRYKAVVFVLVLVLLVVSVVAAFSRGFTFMDMDMEAKQLTVTVGPKEDETLKFEELTVLADEVVEKLSGIQGVNTIGAMAGGGGMMTSMTGGSDSVTLYLLLDEETEVTSSEVIEQVKELTKDMACEVNADASASDMSAFMGSGITVQVRGNDLDKLQELAAEVAGVVAAEEGIVDVKDGLDDTTPSFVIHVDKEKAAEYGMTTAQVFQLVYAKMASETSPTTISTDLKDYKVYIQSPEQSDISLQDIRDMTFTYEEENGITGNKQESETAGADSTDKTGASGQGNASKNEDETGGKREIPLREIAEFEEGNSLNAINRDAQTRYISVTAGIDAEHNITLVSNELKKELEKIELPEGYELQMAGEDEMINDAMEQLYLMLLLAIIFIYLIMVAQFQSFLSPFIIMFTIPLAFTGGLFALFFTGKEVSVVAMIGFVMLAGIIVNNGIVLIDYINQMRKDGMSKKEAIIESGKTRLRPILMTALTTILAMSTMAMGMGSGSEMMQPMAIVTVGGMVYGTLLTLIVVPCIYDAFHREKSMVEEEL